MPLMNCDTDTSSRSIRDVDRKHYLDYSRKLKSQQENSTIGKPIKTHNA